MRQISAVERDTATGWVKLVAEDGTRERFMATSREAAERLAILLGVEFVPIPVHD